LSGLFDFFQSASNTVADNVAGPVDLINAGLGLFGLRSKEPVGGSEWMKRWGLKRDVEMGGARLAGETAGLLSPTLLAAKAPQIAKGLLQAQENAAIPRQMHPEMGAIVYHGSPHKFDKFDSSKIGTGEGAQAYGHGLYLAESPDVAKEYAEKLSSAGLAKHKLAQSGGDLDAAIASAQTSIQNYKSLIAQGGGGDPRRAQGMLNLAEKNLNDLLSMKAGALDEAGNLYKVDLPDTAIAKMLDWDKPLSQQAPEVQKAATEALTKRGMTKSVADYIVANKTGSEALAAIARGAYDARLNVPDGERAAAASRLLQQQGIPGIRYLDGGSRSAGSGSSNYVVFPGQEGLLNILERNGQLLR
jgi:hypothetical protein